MSAVAAQRDRRRAALGVRLLGRSPGRGKGGPTAVGKATKASWAAAHAPPLPRLLGMLSAPIALAAAGRSPAVALAPVIIALALATKHNALRREHRVVTKQKRVTTGNSRCDGKTRYDGLRFILCYFMLV